MSYYVNQHPSGRSCWCNTALGDGFVLGSIQKAIVAYGNNWWHLVMEGGALIATAMFAASSINTTWITSSASRRW